MFDCIVVGGGPAGLNAALVLGRSKRNVMLIDETRQETRLRMSHMGLLREMGLVRNNSARQRTLICKPIQIYR